MEGLMGSNYETETGHSVTNIFLVFQKMHP